MKVSCSQRESHVCTDGADCVLAWQITAASRAPQEADYRELVADVKRYHLEIHDLEDKLKAYVASAKKLVAQGESMVGAADTCCATTGLIETQERINLQPMKDTIDGFKGEYILSMPAVYCGAFAYVRVPERCERVRSDITVMDEELKYDDRVPYRNVVSFCVC